MPEILAVWLAADCGGRLATTRRRQRNRRRRLNIDKLRVAFLDGNDVIHRHFVVDVGLTRHRPSHRDSGNRRRLPQSDLLLKTRRAKTATGSASHVNGSRTAGRVDVDSNSGSHPHAIRTFATQSYGDPMVAEPRILEQRVVRSIRFVEATHIRINVLIAVVV